MFPGTIEFLLGHGSSHFPTPALSLLVLARLSWFLRVCQPLAVLSSHISAFQVGAVADEPTGPRHWAVSTGHPLCPVPLSHRLGQA